MKARFLPLFATFVVLLLLYAAGWYRFEAFGTTRIIANALTDKAFIGIVAIGMTFVILSGGIDLSVGSVVAFTSVFLALIIEQHGVHPMTAFALALAIGALFGASMGVLIYYFKIPPFIATLAGMFVARGATFVLTTTSLPVRHPFYAEVASISYRFPDRGRATFVAGVFLVVLFLAIIIAHFTRFGRDVYAIGGNEDASLLLGVPVGRTVIGVYTLSGILATLGGIVYSLHTRSGYPLAATGLELDAIAAVVVGGTLLTGGVGYVIGTFFGVLMLGLIQTYINFDGSLNSWWSKIFIGILLLAAIGLQKLLSSNYDIMGFVRRWKPLYKN